MLSSDCIFIRKQGHRKEKKGTDWTKEGREERLLVVVWCWQDEVVMDRNWPEERDQLIDRQHQWQGQIVLSHLQWLTQQNKREKKHECVMKCKALFVMTSSSERSLKNERRGQAETTGMRGQTRSETCLCRRDENTGLEAHLSLWVRLSIITVKRQISVTYRRAAGGEVCF